MTQLSSILVSFKDRNLRTLSLALLDYKKLGKSVEEFENDYDCKVTRNADNHILGIMCNNRASMTMMKLKYAK